MMIMSLLRYKKATATRQRKSFKREIYDAMDNLARVPPRGAGGGYYHI